MSRDPLAFAAVNTRTITAGEAARQALVRRLGLGDDGVARLQQTAVWSLLLTYCIEGPLNIDWYDGRIAAWRARRSAFVVASLAVTVLVVAALVLRQLSDSAVAQVSAAVAALVACARILSGAADVKTQLGGFWRARADLKEAFLTFEQTWRGHVVVDGAVADGFETALWQEITNARHVVRAERDTYFSTFGGGGDLLSATTAGLEGLLGRAREASAAALPPRVLAVAEARHKLDQAKADRAAEERRLALLAARPAGMSDDTWRRACDEAEAARVRAEADVARYTELLKSVAKAATMNPA